MNLLNNKIETIDLENRFEMQAPFECSPDDHLLKS